MIRLTLNESDFDDRLRGRAVALAEGDVVLGDRVGEIQEAIYDALPGAIAAKVRRIIPEGFRVESIELKISLGGKVFGIGIDGEMTLTMAPEPAGSDRGTT